MSVISRIHPATRAALLTAAIIVGSSTAKANVIYEYSGSVFSGDIDFSIPESASYSGSIASWSFSNGTYTLNQFDSSLTSSLGFLIGPTDTLDGPNGWFVSVAGYPGNTSGAQVVFQSAYQQASPQDATDIIKLGGVTGTTVAQGNVGSWAPATLPASPILGTQTVGAGCSVSGFTCPTVKQLSNALSVALGNFSNVLSAYAFVTDPQSVVENATIFIEEHVLADPVTAQYIDYLSYAKSAYSFIATVAKSTPLKLLSSAFSTLSYLASIDADLTLQIAKDPPGSDTTTVTQPPDLSLALPTELTQLPNYTIFAATVSDLESLGSYLDAALVAAENYDAANAAGDVAAALIQYAAFGQYLGDSQNAANEVGNDFISLNASWPNIDTSALSASDIGNAIGSICGAPLPSDFDGLLSGAGMDQATIDSLVCKYADEFDDPSLILPELNTDIPSAFEPVMNALGNFSGSSTAVSVDEPQSFWVLLTAFLLIAIANEGSKNKCCYASARAQCLESSVPWLIRFRRLRNSRLAGG